MATKQQKISTNKDDAGRGQSMQQSPPQEARSAQPSGQQRGRSGGPSRNSTPSSRLRERNGEQQGGLMNMNPEKLAHGLGWFSICLGLAEVLAPRGVAKIA